MIRFVYLAALLAVTTVIADEPVTVVHLSDWRLQQIAQATPALKPLLEAAKPAIGTPYQWGGTQMDKGIDCSNFTWQLFRSVGASYERFLGTQVLARIHERDGLRRVSFEDARPGDLLVYGHRNGKQWHGHVVILIDKHGNASGHKGLVLGAHGGSVNAVQFITFSGYAEGYFNAPQMKLRNVLRVQNAD